MDDRLDLADRFIELTGDPDLWTRLQALRTLRQWFYRTNDPAISRRIVETYLARMAEPDVPVVRKNLSEGLTSCSTRTWAAASAFRRTSPSCRRGCAGILEARKAFERDVLLTPVLAALKEATTSSGRPCSRRSTARSSRARSMPASPRA